MLVSKTTRIIEHPTEEGVTFTVRALCAGDMETANPNATAIQLTYDLLAAAIIEWTYDAPVSVDSIKQLDVTTFQWLQTAIQDGSGMRTDAAKNASGANSSPTTGPDKAPSQKSLGT